MRIETEEGRLTVRLPAECTISEAEAAADLLRKLPPDLCAISVDANRLEEIDTAYLQVLLSLKAHAVCRGIAFSVSRPPRSRRYAVYTGSGWPRRHMPLRWH